MQSDFKVYFPVKPKFVTQPFGATYNLDYYHSNGVDVIGHNGTDLMASTGQPVFASHDGDAYYEIDVNQGHGIVIRSNNKFTYIQNGAPMVAYFKTIYWHFCDPITTIYMSPIPLDGSSIPVKAGDFIGWADSTGLSTGSHVHWAAKPCNLSEPPNTWYNLEQNNGYLGCVDVMPYWNGLFAEDLPVTHKFTKTITIGDTSGEVVYLQRKLRDLGLFNHSVTGYYGLITKAAVYAFQNKYVAKDWWSSLQVKVNGGDAVRSLTMAALNTISA